MSIRRESQDNDSIQQPRISKHLIMAAISSGFAEVLTFPIDTIKVYLQLQCKQKENKFPKVEVGSFKFGLKSGHSHPMKKIGFTKMKNAVNEIYTHHGVRGFYRGYKPAVIRASLNNALSATIYKPVRKYLGAETRDCPLHIKLSAGFTTGVATQTVASPTDLLKVRMQADSVRTHPRYHGFRDAIRQIYSENGIRAFWKGIVPSMYRAGFSVAATLGTYDHCKAFILRHHMLSRNTNEHDVKLHIACSLCSGLCATSFACPFDVVKTRYQSQSLKNPIYSSSRHCLKTITKNEGFKVLFKGFFPMYARLGPWQIAFFVVFEFLHKEILGESF